MKLRENVEKRRIAIQTDFVAFLSLITNFVVSFIGVVITT
jgi:hypothetical protein